MLSSAISQHSSTSRSSSEAIVAMVLAALAEVLPRQKRKQKFELSATLFKHIGMDSMQVLAFTFALEQRLGTTLPEEELRRRPVESLQDVVDLISRIA